MFKPTLRCECAQPGLIDTIWEWSIRHNYTNTKQLMLSFDWYDFRLLYLFPPINRMIHWLYYNKVNLDLFLKLRFQGYAKKAQNTRVNPILGNLQRSSALFSLARLLWVPFFMYTARLLWPLMWYPITQLLHWSTLK